MPAVCGVGWGSVRRVLQAVNQANNYKKPLALVVDITCQSIIATSGLRYTNESADKNSEVLAVKAVASGVVFGNDSLISD